jgi:hypothetical protein
MQTTVIKITSIRPDSSVDWPHIILSRSDEFRDSYNLVMRVLDPKTETNSVNMKRIIHSVGEYELTTYWIIPDLDKLDDNVDLVNLISFKMKQLIASDMADTTVVNKQDPNIKIMYNRFHKQLLNMYAEQGIYHRDYEIVSVDLS